MTEYCSSGDVQKRLTTAGYKFCADGDYDGSVSTGETEDTIAPAIRYAGNLVDACVLKAGCEIPEARGAANEWLRDRAIDIAAYRVSTTGGRGIIQILKDDYDAAIALLKSTTKIPGLEFNYPFNRPERSSHFPSAINLRRG